MQETGESSLVDSQLVNMDMTVYYLNGISDYLLLDLKMYLERSGKTVKECERCSRLFLPTRKSDKYCRLPNMGKRKTCSQIMHTSPTDEFAMARNKARDSRHKHFRLSIFPIAYAKNSQRSPPATPAFFGTYRWPGKQKSHQVMHDDKTAI